MRTDYTLYALIALVCSSAAARAEDAPSASPSAAQDFVAEWLERSDAAKESQPHWMTPVITVTPRLEQEFRYDQSWQQRPAGRELDAYGNGKGLELIPFANTELILGVPAYDRRENGTAGWADETLLVKYRLLSANEEHGNYIVTAFLGVSLPTGSDAFTAHHTQYTPTLAFGKGWGDRERGLDIQSTLAVTIPASNVKGLGEPVVWNTALQAHLARYLWPELEVSDTYYHQGPNDGKNQVALASGIVLGRFELNRHVRLIVGGAYQWTVSTFRVFEHTWLVTGRVTF